MDTARKPRVAILAAISVGLALASSCFPLLGTTVASLGPWAPLAILGSGALAWLVSRIYAELAGMYPTAAGVRIYIGQAFGHGRGVWLALLYVFLVVGLGASECTILSQVLHQLFPSIPPLAVCLGFVGLSTILNLVGFEPTGKVQAWLTGALVTGLAAFGIAAFTSGHVVTSAPGAIPLDRLGSLAGGFAGSIFLFVGFEWVVSAVEEADPTARTLPRAMSWSVATLTLVYTILAFAFRYGLGHEALATGVTPHLALGAAAFGSVGLVVMAVLSIVATVTAFNGGILGASRLVYALAREGVLPRPLAQLSTRTLTPWAAILTVSSLTAASALALATTSACRVPILASAAIECFVFATVALAFAQLRTSKSERPRPYRAPFGPAVARVLAVVFFGLSLACVVGAGEWALPTAATLGVAGATGGVCAWRSQRRARMTARKASPRRVVSATRPETPRLQEASRG